MGYVVPAPLMASDVLEMKNEQRCDADKRSISVVICDTNIITIPEAHLRLIITITTTTITTTIADDVPATIPMTAVLESVWVFSVIKDDIFAAVHVNNSFLYNILKYADITIHMYNQK